MGRKKHILPERNYSFSGYFRCETGENISAFFSDKTRAVSEKEAANNEVSVRQRLEGDLGTMSLEKFMFTLNQAVENELAMNA